ncbi:tRNA 2-selenouridine(34) synthase MnmH [Plebeiibacterium marinum]|uniref:tRNA 2-selenouridine(34) synthase MnmH n=1 Tax=Plebeiibacterium marinum TaxID=2992111 RepID=A0AAE3SJK9_9BACT|nr:tRNA 2-selenouridine(34) synthase MnmH [Plebeiobacterium marinum]MCW3805850.1 tRNA 2-selenouridine(34) synthase MnmH [Plebeiobacterium marinum]
MIDIDIETYYSQYENIPVIDVRSPGEFEKGHIPGAYNIPLFNNEERAHVGTVYKQNSKEAAIELGYEYVTPKLEWFINESQKVSPDKKVVVHCWRGGMRSHSFAKHLEENGFCNVKVIDKGYKGFRNFVLDSFKVGVDLKVIGGFTGSGKTHILHRLENIGCQIVDLEGLANHKGSAFGGIGEEVQPTVEQFENNLFDIWRRLDFSKPVYIEDESHNIGSVKLPMDLYEMIRNAIVYFLVVPKEQRAKVLVGDYAGFDNELLEYGIHKIKKKLGGYVTKLALEALENKDYFQVAMYTLNYYDKSYMRGVMRRDPGKIRKIELVDSDPDGNAVLIKKIIEQGTV